jgi:CTP synthase (UTP-ammonia lyase)
MKPTIAIVADYNASSKSHRATENAIKHCSRQLGSFVAAKWVGTEEIVGISWFAG